MSVNAPLLANGLFAFVVGPASPLVQPGAPFFVGSVMFAASLALAVRQFRVGTAPTGVPG